ncbi:phosphoglucosamine mutase [Granulicella sp. 5B5]|uniref:phosphoglucosamine mutase n=1 Tax=Granulicella sp. 5B5 TaxID=1617967 RepID=UPI0015F6A8A9|nr:phosphoglucosamine mutase [Granulicella sp. 5B5]QMV19218.1 phosphoglucosamine mutase [Granulicella sp. 5B5]
MRKLFGTDGIRAVAGEAPLDERTVRAVGVALATKLGKGSSVVMGMDTRESGPWIAATLAAGLREGGATVANAGVITTPAVAFLARKHGFSAGVVISASHNPWRDNGIKVFGGDGYKLPDAVEMEIEAEIEKALAADGETQNHDDALPEVNESFRAEYVRFLLEAVPGISLDNRKVVIDCANGAASAVAPQLFEHLGGTVEVTHASPDGLNINEQCGALHPEIVAAEVKVRGASMGMTFDGDADRALFADEHGNVVNGDAVMLACARDMQARGELDGDVVVATTMSNMGFEAALKRSGISMLRAPVGDKYVLEEMRRSGAALGGEQSGHVLFPARATTGDGLLTALMVLDVVHRSGKTLGELIADLKNYPQVILNVKVREKVPLDSLPDVVAMIRAAEDELRDSGRVVIRYSGTEALARVMIEAESEDAMRRHAEAIAGAIRAELGI